MSHIPTDNQASWDARQEQPRPMKPTSSKEMLLPAASAPNSSSRWERVSLGFQIIVSLAIAGGVLAYLLWFTPSPPDSPAERPSPIIEDVVRVVKPGVIQVRPDTPLDSKLHVVPIQARTIRSPILTVTGRTLASLRSESSDAPSHWQFATGELLALFTDWESALADIEFQEEQLVSVRELAKARVEAQRKVVLQMEKLVAAGTDSLKDLVAERNALVEYQIEGHREVREAETALKLARRTEASLARQLQQAGLEPNILRAKLLEGNDWDIVVAEVPESRAAKVRLGMACEVRFFAQPTQTFAGKVSAISPVISSEKRVLHVQFTITDTSRFVRPGMFAQVGLGTDERTVLLMPADGVLHLARSDYALVELAPNEWQVVEIEVGAPVGPDIEVLKGLQTGDRVLGKGAILLKPYIREAIVLLD
ncbi:MAG: efflux RND transporter periplasmic adaptor subunit [Gemmataceae bacterium]